MHRGRTVAFFTGNVYEETQLRLAGLATNQGAMYW